LFAVPIVIMELIVNLQTDGIGRRDFGGWSFLTYLLSCKSHAEIKAVFVFVNGFVHQDILQTRAAGERDVVMS
jgi:hypothetical protein